MPRSVVAPVDVRLSDRAERTREPAAENVSAWFELASTSGAPALGLALEVPGQLLLNEGTFKLVYLQAGAARIELFAFTEEGRRSQTPDRNEDLGFKHVAFTVDGRFVLPRQRRGCSRSFARS